MQPKFIFSNIIGTFVFSEQFTIFDKILFRNVEEYKNKDNTEIILKNKYKNLKVPEKNELTRILSAFNSKEFFPNFHKKNIELTKEKIKLSVKDDLLVIQAINSIEENNKVVNLLTRRLREWYSHYNPEFSNYVNDNKKFIELLMGKKDKKTEESMGADLSRENMEPIIDLIKQIDSQYKLKDRQEQYLEKLMKKNCPNLTAVAGVTIGAKLIEHANSLKHLAELPASVIQLLGAEKALFRHLKTGARSPRHGLIVQHPLLSGAPQKIHGKIARALADKIAIAVRIDYFKGKFIGDQLRKELEIKLKK